MNIDKNYHPLNVRRCIFIILHNPHNNISKNNLTLYHKIQRTPHDHQQKNSWENGELVVISNSKTLTQLPLMISFFSFFRRVLRFQFIVFLIFFFFWRNYSLPNLMLNEIYVFRATLFFFWWKRRNLFN